MITLNGEKGLIRVEEWAEIEARPGFLKDLNPSRHRLSAIIGRYVFKDRIRCGLTSCHTPHQKGYIVATADGHETNIGKDCGKTHFGVDFETLSRKFDRDVAAMEYRERLWSFTFRLEETETAIDNLRHADRGADWVFKNARPLIGAARGVPEEVVKRISGMVKTRVDTLVVVRQATEKEVEELEVMGGTALDRPHYIDEPIAQIGGLRALYPENDLRALLVLDLEEGIDAFRKETIDDLPFEKLKRWANWANSVDNKLERAAEIIVDGQRLLTAKNLEPLTKVLTSKDELAMFRAYLKTLR